jgi:hypothetical protein
MNTGGVTENIDLKPQQEAQEKQQVPGNIEGEQQNKQNVQIRVDKAAELNMIEQQDLQDAQNNPHENIFYETIDHPDYFELSS